MAELKSCPFCGGNAVTGYAIYDYNCWGVICVECGAYVPVNYGESEEKAIEVWDRRAGDSK